MCLGLDGAIAPLGVAEGLNWQYAAALVIVFLCAALSRRPRLPDPQLPAARYRALCLPPALAVPADLLVLAALFVAGPLAGTPALLISAALLTVFALAMLYWGELLRRTELSELADAMGRWQRDSRDYMNVIRSQRHDLNLHLNAISGLLAGGQYDACHAYVAKLVADAGDVNDIMPLSDAVVGSMLYNMREEARRRGSDITYRITYDMADALCNGFECNKIIGNLLQNAIDALDTDEDRAAGIRLCIFKRRGNTVITCENRFTGDRAAIARAFEPGFSTKRRHEGIGLAMVKKTAERCGGRIYVEFEDELIRFVVNIPNKVNLNAGGKEER